jgi:hypothetical protein
MSFDKNAKQIIEDFILSEKIADSYGPGSNLFNIPNKSYYGIRGPGYRGDSSSFTDVARAVVGSVAPVAIMAIKTVADLGATATTFARHIFSTVGSIFGMGESTAGISNSQAYMFRTSNNLASRYIQRWGAGSGTGGYGAAPVYFINENANQEDLNDQTAFLSSLDAELESIVEKSRVVFSSSTIDTAVQNTQSLLGLTGQQFSLSNVEAYENVAPEEVPEIERRLLPYVKQQALNSIMTATSRIKSNQIGSISSAEINDPIFISRIDSLYTDSISKISELISQLNIQS